MFEKILSLFWVTFFGRGSCSAVSWDGIVASFMLNTLRVDGSWFRWVVISTPVIKVNSDIFMELEMKKDDLGLGGMEVWIDEEGIE